MEQTKIVYGEDETGLVIKKIITKEYNSYELPTLTKKVKVKSVRQIENEEVYDISVNNNKNFFCDGVLVHNCFEIGFIPRLLDGRFGMQMCNLTEINGSLVDSIKSFEEAIESATIIGTLQAGYTDFPYLNSASKELTEEEALLGVSITGWFDNPEILFDEKNQYMMAKLATKINQEWASKIKINPASRITCTKPSGTASLVLKTSSGIHPHHAHRYFRRVQVNKIDNVYQFFKLFNPHASEESVWSATKSDDVISFPLTVSEKAITKDQLTAIEHLNIIRSTQINWVNTGRTEHNKKNVQHNISCTVEVEETEFEEVVNYLFENREYFSAVSLLPKIGDKAFKQAPNQRVYEEDEITWKNLVENWSPVDYTKFEENEDQTSLAENLACAGGNCELPMDKKG